MPLLNHLNQTMNNRFDAFRTLDNIWYVNGDRLHNGKCALMALTHIAIPFPNTSILFEYNKISISVVPQKPSYVWDLDIDFCLLYHHPLWRGFPQLLRCYSMFLSWNAFEYPWKISLSVTLLPHRFCRVITFQKEQPFTLRKKEKKKTILSPYC